MVTTSNVSTFNVLKTHTIDSYLLYSNYKELELNDLLHKSEQYHNLITSVIVLDWFIPYFYGYVLIDHNFVR